jgi:hypothetical protein
VPDSFQPIQRMLDPISTDMEGGNTRDRPRPGDNVGTITDDLDIAGRARRFRQLGEDMLNNGAARFTTNARLGSSYVNKVCREGRNVYDCETGSP